jgi:hypothetical protein
MLFREMSTANSEEHYIRYSSLADSDHGVFSLEEHYTTHKDTVWAKCRHVGFEALTEVGYNAMQSEET